MKLRISPSRQENLVTEEAKAARNLLIKMDERTAKISERIERIPEKTVYLLK